MSETKTVNPFDYLPEDKLQIIREDYENGTYKYENFNQYLKALHDDDLIPEEVLDIIEYKNSGGDEKIYSSAEELLDELHNMTRQK